jgi:hypothetical protein
VGYQISEQEDAEMHGGRDADEPALDTTRNRVVVFNELPEERTALKC